ncbi:MAG: polysaccharide deacetylase family protein [Ginsengibacter sp.]
MEFVKTYTDFKYGQSPKLKVRIIIRDLYLLYKSQMMTFDKPGNWVSFPYYHHVFDDEKSGFEKQLRYLKNFGDFISITDAVSLLSGVNKINGKYFCVSFDDGYQCLYDNMMPISTALDIPVIIYLPTDYIGLKPEKEADFKMIKNNLPQNPKLLSFLDWEECNKMASYNISFGSHTKSHTNLWDLDDIELRDELLCSKRIIEERLHKECLDFACPWGVIDKNFDPVITTPLAKELGYRSFATTNRGRNFSESDLFQIKRDHLLANWPNAQLKYFFGN